MQRRHLFLCAAALAVAAAAFAVYANSLRNGFAWDDHIYVEGNDFVHDPANWRRLASPNFWRDNNETVEDAARPVFLLSLLADRAAWGSQPRGYHLTNVLLHSTNSILVFLVSLIVLPAPAAAAASLLFAVHPVNTEAVDLVSFRPDLLAAFFLLAGLGLHWLWRRQKNSAFSALGVAACAVLYGLALLSKEMAATFPALALALEAAAWPARQRRRWAWLAAAMLAYGAVAGGYWLFRTPRSGYSALRAHSAKPAAPASKPKPETSPTPQAPPKQENLAAFPPSKPQWQAIYEDRRLGVLTMSGVLGEELGLLVLGGPLKADRAPLVVASARSPRAWGPWLLLAAAAAAAAWLWRRKRRLPALALAWIMIAWLPISNALPIYNPIAERYLYLLAVGAVWAIAWTAYEISERLIVLQARGLAAPALVAAVALPYGWHTVARNPDWRSDDALFSKEASQGTGNARVFYNLGVQAQAAHDAAAAERAYRKALSLNPRYVEAQTNLGALLCSAQRADECVSLLRRAVSEKPSNYLPYLALAQALTQAKRPAEALGWYLRAYEVSSHLDRDSALGAARASLETGLHLKEGFAAVHGLKNSALDKEPAKLVALIASRLGWQDQAALGAATAEGRENPAPDAAAYAALGRLLRAEGDLRGAEAAFRAALSHDAGEEPALAGHAALLMDAGRYDQAAPELERAVALDAKDALAAVDLAVCYHHLERLPEAERWALAGVSLDGGQAASLYDLGAIYSDEGKLPEAYAAFEKATQLQRDYSDAWYNLGVVAVRLGRKEEGLRDLERVLEIAPDRLEALNNAAALQIELGRLTQAEELLRRGLHSAPRHPSLHNNLGQLRLAQVRLPEAAQEFQAAIDATARVPANERDLQLYYRNLGTTYQRMGRENDAIAAFRQAGVSE